MWTRRDFARGGLASAAMLATARSALADPPGLAFVNPELRAVAGVIRDRQAAMPALGPATLPAARAMMTQDTAPLTTPPWRRQQIAGAAGAPPVTIYIINAPETPGNPKPVIVHTHGGGFVMGSALRTVPQLQPVAAALDCVIVTVEYRLAPETGYAGSIEDNYAALKWVHAHAAKLGVDPARIAVMGESAGGGHAALLAITARDRGEVPLVLQALTYPMLDDRTLSVADPATGIGTLVWTPARNRYGWQAFLGQEPGTPQVPMRAVPARQADLTGLPPAFIGVGAIDLFVDEDMLYARRLVDAGIPTELVVVPGAFHAFDMIAPQASVVRQFSAARLAALRRALG
jgi:acetyl esterase/lipase